MHITSSSLLGVAFLVLSFAATFTMFQFWGYDYDEVNKKSSCPQWKMNIHRAIGFAYVLVYILMMTEMVPRLWEYQVEFPPRTVVHILLGTMIGVILILKISILRFFRHFEEWMPVLGVCLMICSVLLGVMSLPAFFSERALAKGAVGGGVYSLENRARVARLLPKAGFPEQVVLSKLSGEESLEKGRHILLDKCVTCHDLKTIIAKPRTPSNWVRTAKRMVAKPSLATIISPHEGHLAAAYLIAITPDLQRSAKIKRAAKIQHAKVEKEAQTLLEPDAGAVSPSGPKAGSAGDAGPLRTQPPAEVGVKDAGRSDSRGRESVNHAHVKSGGKGTTPVAKTATKARPTKKPFNKAKAKALFEEECSQCHDTSDVIDAPPTSRGEVNKLLSRMVENGLELDRPDLSLIRRYLIRRFVK